MQETIPVTFHRCYIAQIVDSILITCVGAFSEVEQNA